MGKKGIKQGRGSILTTTRYLKQGGMLCVGRHQEKALLCPSSSGGQLWSSSFCQGRARGLEVLSHHLHPISVGFVPWEAPTQPCSP